MSAESSDGEGSTGEESNAEERPAPVRSSSRKRSAPTRLGYAGRANPTKEESDDSDDFGFGGASDEEDSDENVDRDSPDEEDDRGDEDEISVSGGSPKRSKTSTMVSREDNKLADPDIFTGTEQFICPHCKKRFASSMGLNYHVDKFVCRKSEKIQSDQDDDDIDGEKPSKQGKKRYRKIRGLLKDRTCPTCGRVFTSGYGKKYHVKQGVCQKRDVKDFPFCSLLPGTLMVSPFGVVEVIKDDRAIPSAELPRNIGNMKRVYNNQKARQEAQLAKTQQMRVTKHLAYRKRLNRLRDRDQITQSSVRGLFLEKPPYPELKDPSIPTGFHPNRIVECVLAQDDRPRFLGLEEKIPRAYDATKVVPMKLYLTRRSLTKIYKQSSECLVCPNCGRVFDSRPGCSYHLKAKACSKACLDTKKKADQWMALLEKGAKKVLEKERVRPRKLKVETSNESEGIKDEDTSNAPKKKSSSRAKKESNNEVETLPSKNFVDPRLTYRELKREYVALQSKLLGSMYPSVHKSLKYKRISVRKKRTNDAIKPVVIERIIKKKRRRDPADSSQKEAKELQKNIESTDSVVGQNALNVETGQTSSGLQGSDQITTLANHDCVPNQTNATLTADCGENQAVASTQSVTTATSESPTGSSPKNAFAELPPIIDLRVLLAEVCL